MRVTDLGSSFDVPVIRDSAVIITIEPSIITAPPPTGPTAPSTFTVRVTIRDQRGLLVPGAFVQILDLNRRALSSTMVTDATGRVTFLDIPSPSPPPFGGLIVTSDSMLPDRFNATERSFTFTGNNTFTLIVSIAALPPPEDDVIDGEVPPPVVPPAPPDFPGAAQNVPTEVSIEPLKVVYTEQEDVIVRFGVREVASRQVISNVPIDIFVNGNFALRTSTGLVGVSDINLGPLGVGVHEIRGRFSGAAIELIRG